MDLNKEQLENIIEAYQADFTDGFEQTRKAIYVEDVPMMIKEAIGLAEKGNQTSTKEIFGMDSAYKEAAPNPFGNMYISKSLVVDMVDYIKNLESMAEKSRWKYPDKGELPKDGEHVIVHPPYVSNNFPDEPRHILQYNDGRFQYSLGGSVHNVLTSYKVKAWTYAPVMED